MTKQELEKLYFYYSYSLGDGIWEHPTHGRIAVLKTGDEYRLAKYNKDYQQSSRYLLTLEHAQLKLEDIKFRYYTNEQISIQNRQQDTDIHGLPDSY